MTGATLWPADVFASSSEHPVAAAQPEPQNRLRLRRTAALATSFPQEPGGRGPTVRRLRPTSGVSARLPAPPPDFRRLRPTSGVSSRPPAASDCALGRALLVVLSLPPACPVFSLTEAAAPGISIPVARALWLFLPSWRGGERVGQPRPFQPPGPAH